MCVGVPLDILPLLKVVSLFVCICTFGVCVVCMCGMCTYLLSV